MKEDVRTKDHCSAGIWTYGKQSSYSMLPMNTGELQENRNSGMAYLGRKRISGSQTLGVKQEGIQSFLGPHCGKFTQPASQ